MTRTSKLLHHNLHKLPNKVTLECFFYASLEDLKCDLSFLLSIFQFISYTLNNIEHLRFYYFVDFVIKHHLMLLAILNNILERMQVEFVYSIVMF